MSKAGDWDVVVVGAGHNGLVASFYMGRAGLRVPDVGSSGTQLVGHAYHRRCSPVICTIPALKSPVPCNPKSGETPDCWSGGCRRETNR